MTEKDAIIMASPYSRFLPQSMHTQLRRRLKNPFLGKTEAINLSVDNRGEIMKKILPSMKGTNERKISERDGGRKKVVKKKRERKREKNNEYTIR